MQSIHFQFAKRVRERASGFLLWHIRLCAYMCVCMFMHSCSNMYVCVSACVLHIGNTVIPLSLSPSILSSPLFLPIPPPHPCKSVTESALRLLGDGGATHKEDSLPSESLSKASFTFSPAAITCGAGRGGPLLLFCSEATSPRNSATVKGFGLVNAAIPGGFLVPGNLRCNLGSAMACPQKTLSRALPALFRDALSKMILRFGLFGA